jgi:hypothetical protein
MFDGQRGQVCVGNQGRPAPQVAQQSAQNNIVFVARVRDPNVTTGEPLLHLSPSPRNGLRAFKDSRVRHNPKKPEGRFPRERDTRGFVQFRIEPTSRGLVVRRSQIPRVDQKIDVHQKHLFVRLAFRFGEYFPNVIQIREIAFPQVGWLGSKRPFGSGGLSHAFEPPAQRFVDDLLQSRISFLLNPLEKSHYVIIQTQCGSHTSKHTMSDVLMPVTC